MKRTASDIARQHQVARKTVYEWVKDGCPRERDGKFDEDKVLSWRKAKLGEAQNDQAVKMAAGKVALQNKRLLLQCDKLEVELLASKGKLHDKHACALSLTTLLSESLQPLLSLHTRIKAKFPEQPQAVIDGIAAEVDATFQQIREGLK